MGTSTHAGVMHQEILQSPGFWVDTDALHLVTHRRTQTSQPSHIRHKGVALIKITAQIFKAGFWMACASEFVSCNESCNCSSSVRVLLVENWQVVCDCQAKPRSWLRNQGCWLGGIWYPTDGFRCFVFESVTQQVHAYMQSDLWEVDMAQEIAKSCWIPKKCPKTRSPGTKSLFNAYFSNSGAIWKITISQ